MALHGARHDHRRRVIGNGLTVRRVDRDDVMSVDLQGVPAERLCAADEHIAVPAVHRGSALSQAIEVQDRGEVARPVERCRLHRLPHRALRHLGVAEQHPGACRAAVESHRERHPEPHRQSLPQRPRADVHPWESRDRSGMAFDRRSHPPERQQHLVVDRADRLERGVQGRGCVALGHDESVVPPVVGVLDIGAQMVGEEHRQQMSARHRGGGVPGVRGGRCPDTVDRDLRGELVPKIGASVHDPPSPSTVSRCRRKTTVRPEGIRSGLPVERAEEVTLDGASGL